MEALLPNTGKETKRWPRGELNPLKRKRISLLSAADWVLEGTKKNKSQTGENVLEKLPKDFQKLGLRKAVLV